MTIANGDALFERIKLASRRVLEVTWESEPEQCALATTHHWHVRFDLAHDRIEEWRRWCCFCGTAQIAQRLGPDTDASLPDPACGPFAGSLHGPIRESL
jgi:hypothetical protein